VVVLQKKTPNVAAPSPLTSHGSPPLAHHGTTAPQQSHSRQQHSSIAQQKILTSQPNALAGWTGPQTRSTSFGFPAAQGSLISRPSYSEQAKAIYSIFEQTAAESKGE